MGFGIRFKTHSNQEELKAKKSRVITSLPELMRAAGRQIAISCATSTAPYGTDQGARGAGEKAVRRDIARVYISPSTVYKSFENRGIADAFWFHFQKRHYGQAQIIMDRYHPNYKGVPIRAFDGGSAHQAARRKGKVLQKQRPAMVVQTARNLDAYIKKEVDHVGEAKAGWAACALALGGTRGLPQWVTRHAGKLSPGAVLENYSSGARWSVTMTNGVRYAQEALSFGEKQVAINIGLQRFLKGQINAIMHGGVTPHE